MTEVLIMFLLKNGSNHSEQMMTSTAFQSETGQLNLNHKISMWLNYLF